MHTHPSRIVHGVLTLGMLAGLALPLLGAAPLQSTRESSAQPFPTVIPVEPSFDGPFEATPPSPIDLENYILLGDGAYPIGDEFLGEPDIPLAGIQQDPMGHFGVATLTESPDYRLIWVTDESGVRHNLIVHKDDPLYSGENGFLQHYEDYKDDLALAAGSVGLGVTGAATLMGLGFAGCLPSAGVGCAVAIVGGSVTMLGGIIGGAYFGIFEIKPTMDAMDSLFHAMDSNRGAP